MSTFGRYRVMRRLGSGGMAEVLEAEALGDAGFVRRVAIKRMLGVANEEPSFARMFLDEARIASRLHHANIVSVLDYGVVDGAPFQVLELVDGLDARTLLRRSPERRFPVDVALYLVAQIGHALAAAHAATDGSGEPLGIVHRDVSPGNVLVSWDGDVKLADFGIAFAKDKTEKTEAGTTKGTLVYMSPEQAITGRVDGRADVFSLGCVLHTLLTGASPLADEGLTRFLSDRVVPLAPDLPEDVHSIIEIATQFEVEQRFQSAIAMTEAVGRALATRIDREPRRRLVEYLAPLRARTLEPQGRLDALLRVDLVLAGGDSTERAFHTAAPVDVEVVPDGSARPSRTETRTEGRPPPALPSPVPSSRVASVLVAALLVGVSASGWVWWRRSAPKPAHATSLPSAAAPSAVPLVAAPLPPAEPGASAIAPAASSIPAASARRPARPTPSSVPSAPAPSAAQLRCVGTVYLSCPLAPRAAIAIDGVTTPYHHGDFVELTCTAHAVGFELADGRRASRTASPTSANIRTSPLEILCGLE